MRELADSLLSAHRKGWFRSKPMFERQATASESDILAIEKRLEHRLPEDLRCWLALVGFGTINEDLNIQAVWFSLVESGHLKGGFKFAQDILGNFYACAPNGGDIIFFDRHEPGYAVLAPTFRAFIEELERREYKIMDWVDSIELSPYAWA